MRITDSHKKELGGVYLALTDAEARELRDGLDELLSTRENGWHVHVMDERFWSADESERVEREITVYRADDTTAAF
jgi:hypothetical protein